MNVNDLIEVKIASPIKGRGAFAKQFIKEGTTIEKAPIILINDRELKQIEDSVVFNYTFHWNAPSVPPKTRFAIAMSPCEFINHSFEPNMAYAYDYDAETIEFYTIKDVQPGEELTINYNGDPEDKTPMWFTTEE